MLPPHTSVSVRYRVRFTYALDLASSVFLPCELDSHADTSVAGSNSCSYTNPRARGCTWIPELVPLRNVLSLVVTVWLTHAMANLTRRSEISIYFVSDSHSLLCLNQLATMDCR
jgi:hypothetical protein